ncbi:heat shock 70 kDa protein 12A-like isoform X1 [Mercenaria mercenaria]|uniref:heat shock 70 kDa protein 12A-like isoform X1 n=1 Tax=Mercenaria mercenaria TaxID=6596 RepID=UPI00234EEFEC|nr:heat shock 70 kDa protein 12A-like isoform X1 [Mercenaria mercenaria]XP_045204914.2 heat shock 70 kDa protein 12A-like isoform X1 [Mercenaria mercenaria]
MASNSRIDQGSTAIPVRAGALKQRLLVGAIDFGTTYSGYAFQRRKHFESDPLQKIIANNWSSSSAQVSHKTPSCILFDKEKQFHSFGHDAEQKYNEVAGDGEHWNWYFFKRFKMLLYKDEALTRETILQDDKGLNMPAMTVFTASIKYLKDHMIKTCEAVKIDVRPEDIHWVITVPAIWTDSAKQFMREAAINAEIHTDKISLSLEPEAASLFCRYLPVERVAGVKQTEIRSFSIGEKYMILDCGGGTVDMTVHEIQEDSTLRELAKANGGEFGGTLVDKKFIELLNDVFGPDVMEVIQQRFKDDYLDLMQNFEIKKRKVSQDLKGVEKFQIPVSITDTYKELNNIAIENSTGISDRLKNKIMFKNNQMRVNAEVVKDLFTDVCDQISSIAKEFFQSVSSHRIEKILMVGGFSDSPMLQENVRKTFPRIRVIIPEEAGLAVLKGAVLFGHNPKMITARVCKYSYGIRAFKHFEPGIDPPDKRVVQGDIVLCKDYFSKHATVGHEYKTEEKVYTQEYVPSDASGSRMEVWVYTSPRRHPLYVDEEESRKIGEISVPLHDATGKDNPVVVQFEFGNTELKVKVKETKTGQVKEADFDLLRI